MYGIGAGAVTGAGGTAALAYTGFPLAAVLTVAALLILAGLLILRTARRPVKHALTRAKG